MNNATREQQAADAGAKLEALYEKSTMLQKLTIKAIAGVMVMMESNLDRSVKLDAINAVVGMLIAGAAFNALKTLQACHKATQAPLELIHSMMALSAIDELQKVELRFNTMMQLFVDEGERGDG